MPIESLECRGVECGASFQLPAVTPLQIQLPLGQPLAVENDGRDPKLALWAAGCCGACMPRRLSCLLPPRFMTRWVLTRVLLILKNVIMERGCGKQSTLSSTLRLECYSSLGQREHWCLAHLEPWSCPSGIFLAHHLRCYSLAWSGV